MWPEAISLRVTLLYVVLEKQGDTEYQSMIQFQDHIPRYISL